MANGNYHPPATSDSLAALRNLLYGEGWGMLEKAIMERVHEHFECVVSTDTLIDLGRKQGAVRALREFLAWPMAEIKAIQATMPKEK